MHTMISKAQHALSFEVMGTHIAPIATGQQTSRWELFTLTLAPGGRSPLHTLEADKVFAVMSGTVRLTVGDHTEDVGPGGFVNIPAGTAHNYANVTDTPAGMVALVTGAAGQLEFLRGMSALSAGGPPDPAALAEHTARHGVRILPPPAA